MATTRITPLSGFPELLPEQRAVEQHVLDVLRSTFELHGFAGIETRAVEPLEHLLTKGETSKEVYVLKRLQEQEGSSKDAGLGLHFDLTVPFARYVVENAGKLDFPFRRFQIQKVWRGERPQDGRYREFTQADIDVVGRDVLPVHHDVEVARVMLDALRRVDFLPGFTLQVNNRKVLEGFFRGLGLDDAAATLAMTAVDRLDKQPAEAVAAMLVGAGFDAEVAGRCLAVAEITTPDSSFVERVRALGVEHPLLEEGLIELAAVVDGCASLVGPTVDVVADLKIARGLDYYTGTVFETRMRGHEGLGSICSGGRYDALATDGRTTYPGVGISLGVSRVLVPLLNRGEIVADRKVPSAVLVSVTAEETRAASDLVAASLRARGVPCEVAATAAKFGKQIRYAERRGIPYVWFIQDDGSDGPRHQVKDIRSGEQVAADPDTWSPPAKEDLRAQVLIKEQ